MAQSRENHIAVLEPRSRKVRGARTCRLGEDLRIDYGRLEKYCWDHLEEVDVDLLVIAGATAYADRVVPRHRSKGWSRVMRVTVPVHNVHRWSATKVASALEGVLNFLTGDTWQFEFVKRSDPDQKALQLPLIKAPLDRCSVLPYSGGLDSFAELRRQRLEGSSLWPLLIKAEHGGGTPPAVETLGMEPDGTKLVTLPVVTSVGAHAEQTYRTRTFLFFSVAAIAWKLARANRIVVAEPGPGALGPSLISFGNEHPYRGTHPAFTYRLGSLLEAIWGRRPQIDHPNLWVTKGQLLRKLNESMLLQGWINTRSCSRNVPRAKGPGVALQCGICTGCLFRRMSLFAAGVFSEQDKYFFHDLAAADLDESVEQSARTEGVATDTDRDVANHAVLDHEYLARAARYPASHPEILSVVHELSEACSMKENVITLRFRGLLEAHRVEWNQFLESLPNGSWLARLAREA